MHILSLCPHFVVTVLVHPALSCLDLNLMVAYARWIHGRLVAYEEYAFAGFTLDGRFFSFDTLPMITSRTHIKFGDGLVNSVNCANNNI